jgi:translocation and assembly module TamB
VRRALKLSGLLLLSILALLGWLLATSSGGAWLLHLALGKRGDFTNLQGSLLQRPRLEGLVYRDPIQEVHIQRLDLDWGPRALLRGRLHIRSLRSEGIEYRWLGTAPPAEEPEPTPAGAPLTLPIQIQLDQVQVRKLTIATSAESWTLDRIEISGGTEGPRVRLARLEVEGLGATLSARATLELSRDYPFEADLNWTATHPQTGPAAGSGHVEGDLRAIELSHRVDRPAILETRGRIELSDSGPRLALAGEWQRLRWPLVEQTPAVQSPQGRYRLTGPVTDLALEAETRLEPAGAPPLDLAWSERITPTGTQDLKMQIRLPRGQAELQGEVTWSPDIRWTARLEGEDLDPSLLWAEGTGRLALSIQADGGLSPGGLWTDLDLTRLSGQLREHEVKGQARARLDDRGIQIQSLNVNSGPSHLAVAGRLDWAPDLAWDLELQTRDLDPALALADWPGRLNLEAAVQGSVAEQGAQAHLQLSRLDGQLRGQTLSGQGEMDYRPGLIRLEQVALTNGPNRLRAQGTITETLDLSFELDAPQLAAAWPPLRGSLKANGRFSGAAKSPRLEARIDAADLAYHDTRLQQLTAHALWGPQQVDVDLQAQVLETGGIRLEQARASASGRPENFATRLTVESEPIGLGARLDGGWLEDHWTGTLSALDLTNPQLGPWTLERPAALSLSPKRVKAEPVCLAQEEGRLCLGGSWSPTVAQLKAELATLRLSLIQPWLPTGSRVEGQVSGEADLALEDGEPRGEAEIRITPGRLVLDLEDDVTPPLSLAFAQGGVQLKAQDGGLRLSGHLPLAEDPGLEAKLQLGRPDPTSNARPLSGLIEARISDLSPLELMVPTLSDVQGGLSARLKVSGDTVRPLLEGEARVTEAAANIPELGIELTGIEVSAQGRADEPLSIRASTRSGDGSLDADGRLTLDPERGWPLELHIRGERFQAVRLAEAQAYVSPDLNLAMSGGLIRLDGVLDLPEAQIEIRVPPPSAVTPSDDEVIVGQQAPPEEKKPGPEVKANIQVRLGDKVRLSGHGLTARLEGALQYTRNAKRELAQGSIEVKEGRYQAYGQDLTIERGRLIFAGPPTQPSLDVRATRVSKDGSVKAILDVTGSFSQPLARISSEPPLPEEEALSYLITGRGLAGGEEASKAALLRQALIKGGLTRSQGLLDKLASGIGVDEIQVQQGATFKESSLLLGKYLSPDLYVSYALGLLDPQGAVVLRYRLTERLRLEAQSGQEQGLDLFYKVEQD